MSLGVRVTYLPVGQGTANMVEVYDYDLDARTETLVQLYLIDCGGDGFSRQHVQKSETIIMEAMARRSASIPGTCYSYYLDALSISHQDADHYNVIYKILKNLGTGIRIEKYIRFTEERLFESFTTKTFVKFENMIRCISNECIFFGSTITSEEREINSFIVSKIGEYSAEAHIICANVAIAEDDSAPTCVRRNTLSLYIVLDLKWNEQILRSYHFPGDATVYTMNHMNLILEDRPLPMAPNEMVAPHHGSITSSCDDGDPECHDVLDQFYLNIVPRRQFVSAGKINTHGHPHNNYIKVVRNIVSVSESTHEIYYNILNIKLMDPKIENIRQRLYTTATSLDYDYHVYTSTIFPNESCTWIHYFPVTDSFPSFISEYQPMPRSFPEEQSCSSMCSLINEHESRMTLIPRFNERVIAMPEDIFYPPPMP